MPPALGSASPSSSRISVVLPAPLGPKRPKAQPRGTSRSTPSSAARSEPLAQTVRLDSQRPVFDQRCGVHQPTVRAATGGRLGRQAERHTPERTRCTPRLIRSNEPDHFGASTTERVPATHQTRRLRFGSPDDRSGRVATPNPPRERTPAMREHQERGGGLSRLVCLRWSLGRKRGERRSHAAARRAVVETTGCCQGRLKSGPPAPVEKWTT